MNFKLNQNLRNKRKGYAITLEVLITVLAIVTIINATTYIIATFNTQRYMDTVLTSTITQIAKWGGTNSNAYKANNMDYDVIKNAQDELDRKVAPMFNAKIKGGPEKINRNNTKVYVQMTWRYPGIFNYGNIPSNIKIEMDSIMRPGDLL